MAASCSSRLELDGWRYGAGLEGHVNTAACAAARSGIGNGNENEREGLGRVSGFWCDYAIIRSPGSVAKNGASGMGEGGTH